MGMYIMNGKTFLTTYIKEDPRLVLETQYVVASSLIRKAGRYEKQVINAANILYPPSLMIIDYEDYKDPEYEARYSDHLREVAKPFMATLVQYCLDSSANVVILCAKKEWQYRYLQILKEFILEEFGFHIYDYKKVKKGKEKIVEDDDAAVAAICRKVLKKAKKNRIALQKMSERGRDQYVNELDKSEMIKKLKKKNLYVKGMSKSEMMETLKIFL